MALMLPDGDRVMPETLSERDAAAHPWNCRCNACLRPEAAHQRLLKRRRENRRVLEAEAQNRNARS